jgi:hypothetical protein
VGELGDLPDGGHCLGGGAPGVRPAVRVRGGDHVLQVRDAGVDSADRAAGVGDQRGEVHAVEAVQLGRDLVGVGERGHGLRGDERGHLDALDPGGDQRLEHRQLVGQRQRVLQLQAVAHADLADVDRHRQHQIELVHAGLLAVVPMVLLSPFHVEPGQPGQRASTSEKAATACSTSATSTYSSTACITAGVPGPHTTIGAPPVTAVSTEASVK